MALEDVGDGKKCAAPRESAQSTAFGELYTMVPHRLGALGPRAPPSRVLRFRHGAQSLSRLGPKCASYIGGSAAKEKDESIVWMKGAPAAPGNQRGRVPGLPQSPTTVSTPGLQQGPTSDKTPGLPQTPTTVRTPGSPQSDDSQRSWTKEKSHDCPNSRAAAVRRLSEILDYRKVPRLLELQSRGPQPRSLGHGGASKRTVREDIQPARALRSARLSCIGSGSRGSWLAPASSPSEHWPADHGAQ